MPDISGRFDDQVTGACLWCERPAREWAMAPGLGREVPLHPTCGASIIYAYRRWLAGGQYRSVRQAERATRVFGPAPKMLDSGATTP